MREKIFFSYTFFWLIFATVGDHFYGGIITWKPRYPCASASNVSIVITQTYIWSYLLMPCNSSMISSNQIIHNYKSLNMTKLDCINNCRSGTSGYSSVYVIPYCISSSSALETSTAQRSDIVTLESGNDFWAAYQGEPWRTLATNPSASWSLATNIKVIPRPDNGLYNHAPISNFMSPIYVSANSYVEISIPVVDADGDFIRCRWANTSAGVDECGGVCPPNSLPPGTTLYSNCNMVIASSSVVGEWYAFTIMVEDFVNSTSLTPLSSIPIQFLIKIVSQTSCASPTITINPSVGSCLAVTVGQSIAFQLLATIYCSANVSIIDIPIQAFSGVIEGGVYPLNSTTYGKSIYWTPTAAQEGYQMMCTMAIDSRNTPPTPYCFTFYVSTSVLSSCPTNICPITTTITVTSTTPPTTTTVTSITGTTKTTTTTTTTEPSEFILYKWLIIGSLVGIPLLLTLIIGSCLCGYYCCPCNGCRTKLFNHRKSTKVYHTDFNNRNVSSSTPIEDVSFKESRPIRPKPKRVTIISLPPSSSLPESMLAEPHIIADYYRMHRTPDYERNINNVHVRHFRWPEQWTRNDRLRTYFDSID